MLDSHHLTHTRFLCELTLAFGLSFPRPGDSRVRVVLGPGLVCSSPTKGRKVVDNSEIFERLLGPNVANESGD
jgi:hypothetical protein